VSRGSKGKGGGKGEGRAIRLVSRVGVSRGLMGGSRPWAVIASLTLATRLFKKISKGTPQTAYSEELRPGDCLIITHDREPRIVRAPS
jgi:hypothetical protein